MSNKTCGECKYHDKYSCLQLKNVVYIASTRLACIRFCPKKPTNGDKIIAAGNEGIAAFACGLLDDKREETLIILKLITFKI